MDYKKIIIGVVVVFALLVLVALLGVRPSFKEKSGAPETATKEGIPENIVVPERDSVNVPENFAIPTAVADAGENTDSVLRTYDIEVRNGEYSKDTIVVRHFDLVNINLSATDADYAFTQPDYGYNLAVRKGDTGTAKFQATLTGKFTFYCASCGGPAKGPVGYLIVIPK